MAARVESQAGGADDGAAPSIPSAFENDYVLGATEAIMWIACRRRFSHDTIREHLRRHRDRGQWRYGRSQLRRPLQGRAEKAERQLIGLIIGGVPATGMLDDEGDPDHNKRVLVPIEFLKDGAYIELLSGNIRADPLLDKHSGYQRPTYRDVDIDRDAFFKALAAAEPRSQATDRGNEQETCPASTRRRAVLPFGPPAEVQLAYLTLEQTEKFIEIEKAFAEFCDIDPKLSELDSTKPGPKCDAKDFEEWYALHCPIHDAATERFVELFREIILVAIVLYGDKEIVLPPEYWAKPADVSTDSEVEHAPHEGEGLASLTVTSGKIRGLSPNDPNRRLTNSRVVLRREEWEKWITDAIPDSQHGHQEPAETPSPAQATPVGPSDKQEKPQRNRKRDVEKDAKLRTRIEMVLAKARTGWPVSKKRPEIDVMAKELERLHRKNLGYKFEAIRKILKGTYSVSRRLKIPGL